MSVEQIPTSEVLNRAADLIEERGWGHMTNWGGTPVPLCASNAITVASGQAYGPAHKALTAHLEFEDIGDVFRWNDAPGRTADDVTAALREAARERADVAEAVTVR